MDKKKELILVLTIVLVAVNLLNILFFLLTNYEGNNLDLTGQATQVQGTSTLCINNPPSISAIADQSATVNSLFTYQVSASDVNDDLFTFSDNTSLFDINSSGYISFTPTIAGVHYIEITARENRSCTNHSVSQTMLLTIAAALSETPSTPSAGGGGGGGAAYAVPKEEVPLEVIVPKIQASFQISDGLVKVTLKKSQSLQKTIIITNDGGDELKVRLSSPTDLIEVVPSSFTLASMEDVEIKLIFNPKVNAKPDVYNGEIKVSADYIALEGQLKTIEDVITYVLEIESERVLFDGSLDLRQRRISTGDYLEAVVTISGLLPGTVKLIYTITDKEGVILFTKDEEMTIEEQVSFSKKITLPEELAPGEYILSVKIVSGDSFASTTEMFTIEAEASALIGLAAPLAKSTAFLIGVPLLLVLTLISLIVFYAYQFVARGKSSAFRPAKGIITNKLLDQSILKENISSKGVRNNFKLDKPSLSKPIDIAKMEVKLDLNSIKRKLSLLEESYQRGFIRKESYFKAKENLQKIIRKGK
ncbi:hypothetical protein J4437_04865 [Candidatus Woesearchaeota archaeon]|nr:hypothetical protein [Candidatus Woesearchaeota archaeon]